MNSILITGCNRGLGLGLVKEFLKLEKPKIIFATCRNIEAANVSHFLLNLPCEIGAILNVIKQKTQNLAFIILPLCE